MNIEIIGYIASLITMIGFTRSNESEIRVISGVSCLFWILYGILLSSPSIIIMNIGIVFLHFYKLTKKKNQKIEDEM